MLSRIIAATLIAAAGVAHAQSYPTKPVRLVAGFPAGGGVDATARAYAQKLGEYWGQNVIVENRSGANGMVGAQEVVRSPKDGYTLFLSTPSEVALNPLLYAKMNYEPLKDLAPISLVAIYPNVMVVNASVSASTVNDVLALAKKTSGGLHYGSSGAGRAQARLRGARGEGATPRARRRAGQLDATGVRHPHPQRDREVREDRQGREYQGGLTNSASRTYSSKSLA